MPKSRSFDEITHLLFGITKPIQQDLEGGLIYVINKDVININQRPSIKTSAYQHNLHLG